MSLTNHFKKFGYSNALYAEFFIQENLVGLVHKKYINDILACGDFFEKRDEAIKLLDTFKTLEERSAAINCAMKICYEKGLFKVWRDELVCVATSFYGDPIALIERGASLFLGIIGYGVFLNGFTYKNDELHMWVAKRSEKKKTYPGKYDVLVGGGISGGLTPMETLLKESGEEAGISKEIICKSKFSGVICYERDDESCYVERGVMFSYDLLLHEGFKPTPVDGEVDSFELWPVHRVISEIENTDKFKDNCNLIIIDFLIRQGVIDSNYPNYDEIVRGINHNHGMEKHLYGS